MTLICRDAFARTELHRECVPSPAITCTWCGGLRPSGSLFRYRTETDGGGRHELRGLFCSKACLEAYHDFA